jgi:Na+-transporting NADH:ubiquinone oxidoreductase subunit F
MLDEYPKHGQYVMFQLAPGLNRAYSIASLGAEQDFSSSLTDTEWLARNDKKNTFTLIIKRIAEWRGSPLICDAEVGTTFSGMLPLGHFILQDNSRTKCFIWTGTGFAPVYCQALGHSMREEKAKKIAFVFWVRNLEDSFYEEVITTLGKSFESFEYVQYFSREDIDTERQRKWYVTDWITPEQISGYEEYYLCGSPAMVKSAREKLEALGVAKEDIFWEQF